MFNIIHDIINVGDDIMEILVRGDKIKVTEAIKKYIESKVSKLDKYFDQENTIKANALIKVRGEDQIIEITIPTIKYTLRAEEKHKDLYAAIDLVIEKLEKQIRKNKNKIKANYKNAPKIDFDFSFEDLDVTVENKIVKRKTLDIKPMDEEEAILQMELLDHDFFVFKNVDENAISVLYKRKDGNYGIINSK